ncbi:DUF6338 family protein [Nocardia salmonicida]|uniref:DUF6338 family protein n=1 Tax=Nocardia salmonicida TaxID=53431 RepID=UPI00340E23AC
MAQFFVLLLLVVPGITFSAVRRRMRGPGADDKDFSARLANAIAVSIALACLYALVLGPWLITLWTKNSQGVPGYIQRPQMAAITAGALAFAVPAAIAASFNIRRVRRPNPWWKLWQPWWNPWWKPWRVIEWREIGYAAPSAWDANAPKLADCFVRIRTGDGYWVGGYIPGAAGFISTHPQPRDIFIPEPWNMGENGEFLTEIPEAKGTYVPLTGSERVEWLNEPL